MLYKPFKANFYSTVHKTMIILFTFFQLEIGNFPPKIGEKDTFWRWDNNQITAIKSTKNKPCTQT